MGLIDTATKIVTPSARAPVRVKSTPAAAKPPIEVPSGARFDSPGRLALGRRVERLAKPQRGAIPTCNDACGRPRVLLRCGVPTSALMGVLARPNLESRPVGACRLSGPRNPGLSALGYRIPPHSGLNARLRRGTDEPGNSQRRGLNPTTAQVEAPTGARFDSPGRLALGRRIERLTKPQRGEIPGRCGGISAVESRARGTTSETSPLTRARVPTIGESRPVGPVGALLSVAQPRARRPGLSNPAPFGAERAAVPRNRPIRRFPPDS
jgi:hypothetical protein